MKKFLSLLLCLVFAVTMLASCSEDAIGDYEYPNFVPKETPAITLDFYVIAGEGTSDLAKDTVERMLSQYTETKYKTSLVLHYIAEADYKAELLDGINKDGADKADIVLVKGTAPSEELKKEIQDYVKKHTAPYKYPRIVEFLDEMPKTVSGKIKRNELRARNQQKA